MSDVKSVAETLGNSLASFYDKAMIDVLKPNMFTPKPYKYIKVKRPRYIYIKCPILVRHYDEWGDFEGWLISFVPRWHFRWGTKIVEEPVYRKSKPRVIKFRRYGPLSNEK